MVRQVAARDPSLARRALAGLAAYETAPRPAARAPRPAVARVAGACLRDHGGAGAPIILIPSLINPPDVLDLDDDVSLAAALVAHGRQVLLVDWGAAAARSNLGIGEHVDGLLLPLLEAVGEPATLIGYCLGGTMAIAAAELAPVRALVTLAAPWHFAHYPDQSRAALGRLWKRSEAASQPLGALPTEVLQAAFWALDPERTVSKFAQFADADPGSDEARRFVTLEDWANEGEPLPLAAARELFEDLFKDDLSGRGRWQVGGRRVAGRPSIPAIHLIAGEDRIVPPDSAPGGQQVTIASGHVGMIVGRARTRLHKALFDFLSE